MPGTLAIEANAPSYSIREYTSSDSTIADVGRNKSASTSRSEAVAIVAVGLCGVLSIMSRVRGDSTWRTRSQSIWKRGGCSGMCTGRPPARSTAGA